MTLIAVLGPPELTSIVMKALTGVGVGTGVGEGEDDGDAEGDVEGEAIGVAVAVAEVVAVGEGGVGVNATTRNQRGRVARTRGNRMRSTVR